MVSVARGQGSGWQAAQPKGPPVGQGMLGPGFPALLDTQVPPAPGASLSLSGAAEHVCPLSLGSDLLETLRTHSPHTQTR